MAGVALLFCCSAAATPQLTKTQTPEKEAFQKIFQVNSRQFTVYRSKKCPLKHLLRTWKEH